MTTRDRPAARRARRARAKPRPPRWPRAHATAPRRAALAHDDGARNDGDASAATSRARAAAARSGGSAFAFSPAFALCVQRLVLAREPRVLRLGAKRPPELEERSTTRRHGAEGVDGDADDAPAPVAGPGDADPAAAQGQLGAGADADEPRPDAAAELAAR